MWGYIEKRSRSENKFLRKFYTFIISRKLKKRGSYIGGDAKFKNKPVFPHGIYGVFISSGSEIGSNVIIYQQVTIGSNTLPGSNKKGSPIIGDNCLIGAGAKIIGNVMVGDNVRIGANAVVVTDVPDNSIVVNQPSRIITKDKDLENEFVSIG